MQSDELMLDEEIWEWLALAVPRAEHLPAEHGDAEHAEHAVEPELTDGDAETNKSKIFQPKVPHRGAIIIERTLNIVESLN